MKLTQTPNLRVEDFQTEAAWIGRLFVQLNGFFQSLNTVITKNVDYFDNIKAVTKDYDITSFQSFSIQWPYTDSVPGDLRVTKANKGDEQTPTILEAAWQYDNSKASITITRMVEITDTPAVSALSGRYRFSVRATV